VSQQPLNASARSAGTLLSSFVFEVPEFQREYSWADDEVADFWSDLQASLESEVPYFLGLVILTDSPKRKFVVDGQQRLITLTLLAAAIYFEARQDRKALADRIQADFIRSIDYDTDKTDPRLFLSDEADNHTFQTIIKTGEVPTDLDGVFSCPVNKAKPLREPCW
jgi:uncharacterized protein with ParB-like and HNH nuclease domain